MIIDIPEVVRLLTALHRELPHISPQTAALALSVAFEDDALTDALLDTATKIATKIQPIPTAQPTPKPPNLPNIIYNLITEARRLDHASARHQGHTLLPHTLWTQFLETLTAAEESTTLKP